VFREAAGRLVPEVVRILGSALSLEEKVEGFVHAYIDTVRQNPFLPGYVLAELHHHPERLTALREISRVQPSDALRTLRERLAAELEERARSGSMRRIPVDQFIVNVASLCVFPFAARPVLDAALGLDDQAFEHFLDERREALPSFILAALRP